MSNRGVALLADIALLLAFALLTASVLGISLLCSTNTPTGGDAASHLLYARQYADSLLWSGQILPWMPEVFAGFPFLSYYFPLPFIGMALLAKVIPFAPAFKWGSFAAALLLPGLVHLVGRRWFSLPWTASILGGIGAFTFLLHEQNSIWGGNLLSTLSGEFAYSYGLLFALLACLAWSRASSSRLGWVTAALLEAATGFSHGFPLLVTGFSTIVLFCERERFWQTFRMLAKGHLLAFCLLGGWLWPMLEMHGYTIPNDAAFPLSKWSDLLPLALRPLYALGTICLLLCLLIRPLREQISPLQARAMRYLAAAAALAGLGFVAGDQLGLANIRFFPMAWLFFAILCGWGVGLVINYLPGNSHKPRLYAARAFLSLAVILGSLGWLAQTVRSAPDWSLWNHSGLEAKPQWHNLAELFPAMSGSLWSPRLVFEHDPANNDLGSTRALEALPLFIGRPVLEGLYMESALTGPAVYLLQSEISTSPSSPLVRFPSGSLDPSFAALHLQMMYADTILLRSAVAKQAVEASGLFRKVAQAEPFALYRLRDFSGSLAEVVTMPVINRPRQDWMNDSFSWFRTRSRFMAALPVYGAKEEIHPAAAATAVKEIRLQRDYLHFETEAVGRPHLIRMSWHPRWQLESAGALYLAGPGFMLVVPQERDIILRYGHTTIGWAGMVASSLSALLLLVIALHRRQAAGQYAAQPEAALCRAPLWGRFALYWGAMLFFCLWFIFQSPERIYNRAFDAFRINRFEKAAPLFQRAFEGRRSQAGKEEALFWLAKSYELAGKKEQAMQCYLQLVTSYHGFWIPESLYTYVRLAKETGQEAAAAPYSRRLKDEYPASRWSVKLKELEEAR